MNTHSASTRRFEKTRQGIISAAREILRTEGVDALSMRLLAEKVDYSPSALYKYFNNKEEIIDALRKEGWTQMEGLFRDRVNPQQTIPQMLIESAMAYLDLGDRHPELYQLMFNSSVNAPADLETIEKDPNFSVITELIRKGVENAEFTLPGELTVLEYRYLAWFILHGICMLKVSKYRNCLEEFDPIAREIVRKFVRFSAVQPGQDSSVY
jgi:AcrR family transcriptional regulator